MAGAMSPKIPRFGNRLRKAPSRALKPTSESRDSFDAESFGLKVLHDTADADADIVAVHGLNGHPRDTFTADNGVCWLESLLPAVCPRVRVFSYGYDARTHAAAPLSRAHLHEHAEQLLEALTRQRKRTGTERRPIIFIGHSLGGLIIKSTLILSSGRSERHLPEQKSIKLSTWGLLFLGTPHQGGAGVSLGKLAVNILSLCRQTKTEYLNHLERNSEWLEHQQALYLPISNDFKTVYFYELFPTRLPGGRSLLVVPRDSAVVPGAVGSAKVGIAADHREMVKYRDSTADGFQKVVDNISWMLDEAPSKISANWQEHEFGVRGICSCKRHAPSHPPRPSPPIPITVSPHFLGRKSIIIKLRRTFSRSSPDRAVILHGRSGMGKTQAAAAYAKIYKKRYTHIYWVDGSNSATLTDGFKTILRSLSSSTSASALTRVLPEKSLIIVDNLKASGLAEWLPPPKFKGNLIITSKSKGSYPAVDIETGRLATRHALRLLRATAGRDKEVFAREKREAVSLIKLLGGVPKAVAAAGEEMERLGINVAERLRREQEAPPGYAEVVGKSASGEGGGGGGAAAVGGGGMAGLPPDMQKLLIFLTS